VQWRPPASVYLRRRLVAGGAGIAILVAIAAGAGAFSCDDGPGGGEQQAGAQPAPKPVELPRGGRAVLPDRRVVAFYGAPQSPELGVLGIGSPGVAARKLERQARPYSSRRRPVLPALELITVIANADPGDDGSYRSRQPNAVIRRYLRAARRHDMLLLLDIQPGRSDFFTETTRLKRWLRQPDVGLALDPEWHTPGAVPGTQIGSVQAEDVNAVARHVAAIVRKYNLPEKLFVVHQFTPNMIAGKERVQQPPGLAMTMNVDGFGDRPNKIAKYHQFTHDGTRFRRGYKLFYEEDTNLMTPGSVLELQPRPDFIVYE
jgi:hypothetical protein